MSPSTAPSASAACTTATASENPRRGARATAGLSALPFDETRQPCTCGRRLVRRGACLSTCLVRSMHGQHD
eukprot:6185993-Pleurochrysis_carterae.AAC.4